jgi:hypothetical protein
MSFLALGATGAISGGAAAAGAGGLALGGLASGLFGGSDSGKQRLGLVNPGSRVLGDLFGTRFTRKGGFIKQGDPNALFATKNISPAIESFVFNPLIGNQGDIGALRSLFQANPIANIVERGMQGFAGLSDIGLEGAATGFRTDATPAFDEAIRRFGVDILPQIAETSGLGLRSSGFEALAGREAANLLGQAALTQLDLDEAAAQRRLGLLPIAGQLQAAEAAFPVNIAADIEAGAGRPLSTFMSLLGQGNQTPLLQQGFPTQDRTTDLLGSLGGLASLFSAIGGFGGGGA